MSPIHGLNSELYSMKGIINFFVGPFLLACSSYSLAFTCQSLGNSINTSGSINVIVNLQPSISPGQNLVVDLSQSIQCKNDNPEEFEDPVRIGSGSAFQGIMSSFTGSISYYGKASPFPLQSPTAFVNHSWATFQGWQTQLYLTPISTASGVILSAGSLFAQLVLEKIDTPTGAINQRIIWNLYASNDVFVPTGGCDVSARDVTVNLPEYPASTAIPLTIHCAQNQNLGYYLSGSTEDSGHSIFTNTAFVSPSKGIGIQLNRNGTAIPTNSTVSLGNVGPSAVNLGLTATYARTSGPVTAGNVQSIIGVTFVYE